MNCLSRGMALVRQWLPDVEPWALEGVRSPHEPVAVEFSGTLGIWPVDHDRIEAAITGGIRAQEPNGASRRVGDDTWRHRPELDPEASEAKTRVEARRWSSAALAEADPFVWLQLIDDRGTSLTRETFLGHGIGIEYNVHARMELATRNAPMRVACDDRRRPREGSGSRAHLASGLHGRIVARTYRNPSGPQYHSEVLTLSLLPTGAELQLPAFPSFAV